MFYGLNNSQSIHCVLAFVRAKKRQREREWHSMQPKRDAREGLLNLDRKSFRPFVSSYENLTTAFQYLTLNTVYCVFSIICFFFFVIFVVFVQVLSGKQDNKRRHEWNENGNLVGKSITVHLRTTTTTTKTTDKSRKTLPQFWLRRIAIIIHTDAFFLNIYIVTSVIYSVVALPYAPQVV